MRICLWLWLLFVAMIIASTSANADELRPGYLEFTQSTAKNWRLVWKAPLKTGITQRTRPILPGNCKIIGAPVQNLEQMAVTSTSKVECIGDVSGKIIGLSEFSTSRTDVLARVAILNRPVQAYRLTATAPKTIIAAKPDTMQIARTYFITGFDHILAGYDHLLFVVALVLLLSGIGTIVKAVTAFTIAHSITLIGTTMGLFGLPQQPVEALIALSIIFLAVEIAKKNPRELRLSERWPWLVSFVFGLLHGFGFAGALREIGLPEDDVPTALLTFNLGVEAGQLIVVFAALSAAVAVKRVATPLYPVLLRATTYAIGTTASFWFLERMIA